MKLNNLIGQNPSSSCNLFRSLERGAREGLFYRVSFRLENGIGIWNIPLENAVPFRDPPEWNVGMENDTYLHT